MVDFVRGFVPPDPEAVPQYLEELTRRLEEAFTQATEDISNAGGGGTPTNPVSGQWTLLDETDLAGDLAVYQFTWDETLYNEIKVKFSGIQPATDAVSLYCRVGSADGATIYNSTNDYAGSEKLFESASWSALVDTTFVRLGASFGSDPGEVGSGNVIIDAFDDSLLGCTIKGELLYINSVANQRALQVQAFLDGGNALIDTIQLYWASGNFENTGTIRVYGLGK